MNPAPIHGDVDYEAHGVGYSHRRRADPRIEALIHAALGPARSVLNVGAGAGSYEPLDRHVIAIEPSASMRAQRPPHLTPAIDGRAEALPLDDDSVDAAMATLSVHQWADKAKGLRELRRVSRGPVVILTFDGDDLHRFWLADYAPELIEAERHRFMPVHEIRSALGGTSSVMNVPIPADCTDGFTEAFYARPERMLDPGVRRSQSAWTFVPFEVQARLERTLGEDLRSGVWDARYGHWRLKPVYEGALRLIVALPGATPHSHTPA